MLRTLFLMSASALVASLAAPRPTAQASYVVPVAGDAGGSSVRRDDDGLFRVAGARGRARVAFVVDTGATTSVVSRDDAARLGVVLGATARLSTAGGETRMRWGRIDGLVIAGRPLPPLDIAVPDDAPPHPLLGQDAIAALGRITIERDRLVIAAAR